MTIPLLVMLGMPVVITPRFEPMAFCRNIEKQEATVSLVVSRVCQVLINHAGTSFGRKVDDAGFSYGCCSFSYKTVQLENLARHPARYAPRPASPFAERCVDTDTASGGAPFEASPIQATHDRLRSAGTNTVLLRGQPAIIFVAPSSGLPSCLM